MRIKLALISTVILALVSTPLGSQTPPEKKDLSLTMEEAIVKALKNNLNLAVQIYNPAIAEETISQAKEYFYPQLQLGLENQHTESPSYWAIQSSTSVMDKMTDYSVALAQQFPTGGNLSLSFAGYKDYNTQAFQLINPRYGSTLRFDFTQPLLKNFGFKVSRRMIIIAQNNRDISYSQLESTLMDTIYSVEEAYWNLAYSIENYRVWEQSLQLARDLLDKNKKEVEVGQLAPIEILNAQATVALREADMLAAKAAILRAQDVLKNVLNLSAEAEAPAANIVPADKPGFIKKEVSLDRSLQEALDRRPNLRAARKDIDNKALNFSVAKNQTLPSLDFKASYWSPGISGDRLIYLDNNPFLGVILRTEPGSPSQASRDAFRFLYSNWTVGLTLSIPLSTVISRADYALAKLELEQTQTQLKNLEQQITLEVSDAVRNIEINAQRYEAYKLARELAEKQLAAEEKKLGVGLSTNFFVLDAQDKLSTARSQELKSLVDYNLSLVQLERATGTALTSRNISVSQFQK